MDDLTLSKASTNHLEYLLSPEEGREFFKIQQEKHARTQKLLHYTSKTEALDTDSYIEVKNMLNVTCLSNRARLTCLMLISSCIGFLRSINC